MMGRQVNPGSLNVRLGVVLQRYEEAVFGGDLATASSMLGIVASYCSVKMTAKEYTKFDAMPGFAYGDGRSASEIFRDMNASLRYLLNVVKQHGVFTREDIETGDASSMDEVTEFGVA